MGNEAAQLAEMIKRAGDVVVFTGAGISTESGISDYRSKGGRWQKFQPVTIQEFQASDEKRKEYWQMKLDLLESLKNARPNEGHKAIAELEKRGKLKGLITQNIDGLHQAAGNSKEKTIEIHGTNLETVCLSCSDMRPWQEVYKELKNGVEAPLCSKCGGFLKPNTISFGQMLDQALLKKAFEWAADCDLLLAVGSTLVVEPAASIPRTAKNYGAALCIITLSETPLDSIADLKISQPSGHFLKDVIAMLN
jgi:NAD-dependent deacetylase